MDKENLVKHYWDCASALEPETHTHKLLKSYYMTICRKLAKSSISMPKEKFSRNMMCRHCSSKWNESDFQMKLKPQQIAHSTKARKQIEKLYDAKKSTENRRALTRKQRKRAKWLSKRVLNSVEIQCELCKHKTKLPMQKPSRKERDSKMTEVTELDEILVPETVTPAPVKNKKKKKKNKDKTAGLKLDKVQVNAAKISAPNKDVAPTKPHTNAASITTDTPKGAAANAKPQSNNKSANKADATKKQAKPTAKLSQPLKAKKKNAKAAAAPNIQSKTQQKNSLLQLAAMLKAQTANKSGENSAHRRLESLLK
ncbi:uncharacterized protein LOC118743358 [Rhagoletis pomonella]|uniref:uncharacterized protein LOC118743358 n=1 Tax=Rhagoletis pomonella TaxID=28610 RepID=UPI0017823AC2|nr:uncharacterized protein LOC118743358 [Rhagoletis pomonella]